MQWMHSIQGNSRSLSLLFLFYFFGNFLFLAFVLVISVPFFPSVLKPSTEVYNTIQEKKTHSTVEKHAEIWDTYTLCVKGSMDSFYFFSLMMSF